MKKTPITKTVSTYVVLNKENVDTDQIYPGRFLKVLTKYNLGQYLFYDWRYKDDKPIESFVLKGSKTTSEILVTGSNFGCGSSREHAVWALYDHGFRVILSTRFADIFKHNALTYGMLLIELDEEFIQSLINIEKLNIQVEIDLVNQLVTCFELGESRSFEIDAFRKHSLMNGLDDFEILYREKSAVEEFLKEHPFISSPEKLCV